MARIKLPQQTVKTKDYHLTKLKQYYQEARDLQKQVTDLYGAKAANVFAESGLETVAKRIEKLEKSKDLNLDEIHDIGRILGKSKGHFGLALERESDVRALADLHDASIEEALLADQAQDINMRVYKITTDGEYEEVTSVQRDLLDVWGWDEKAFDRQKKAIEVARETLRNAKPMEKLKAVRKNKTERPKNTGTAKKAKVAQIQANAAKAKAAKSQTRAARKKAAKMQEQAIKLQKQAAMARALRNR